MSWITLTADDVLRSLTGAERSAVRTAATAEGQADPLLEILGDVVREVRGYVAANTANTLGDGATIPDELKNAALSRARFESLTRLPVGRSLLTEDRVKANEQAIQLLRDVARGAFRIAQPVTATTEEIGAPKPSVGTRTRTYGRAQQDGL